MRGYKTRIGAVALVAVAVSASAYFAQPADGAASVGQFITTQINDVGGNPTGSIVRTNGEGTYRKVLLGPTTNTAYNAQLSPDHSKILVTVSPAPLASVGSVSGQGLGIMNSDGTGYQALPAANAVDPMPDATWNSDGTKIYIKTGDGSFDSMNLDGTARTNIVNDTSGDVISLPAVSAVATKIAYTKFRPGTNTMVYTAGLAGASPTAIYTSPQDYEATVLGWSPDGSRVFINERSTTFGSTSQLFSVTAAGSSRVNYVTTAANTWVNAISFSPDGTKIAYHTHDFDYTEDLPVHIMSATDGSSNVALPLTIYGTYHYLVWMSTTEGDFNSDNKVNILDVSDMLTHFGQSSTGNEIYDLAPSSTIDQSDLDALLASFGT